ncbi:hypothetical protein BJX66DRAFT_238902 [Aspergillus keveii]|uniref:Transmembrane protein n=1 Tax=Aspergillus keveii TaxID=714993 RepID=A0ABR4G0V8_9EURO
METSRGSFRVRRRTLKSVSKPPFRLATRLRFPATPAPAAAFVICCCSGTTVPEALRVLFLLLFSPRYFQTLSSRSLSSRQPQGADWTRIFRSSDHGQTIKENPQRRKRNLPRDSAAADHYLLLSLPSPLLSESVPVSRQRRAKANNPSPGVS